MKIKYKILLSFYSVIGLLIIASALAFVESARVDYFRKEAFASQSQLLTATSLRGQVRTLILEMAESILARKKVDFEKFKSQVEETNKRINSYEKAVLLDAEFTNRYELERSFSEEQIEIVNLKSSYNQIYQALLENIQICDRGEFDKARDLLMRIKHDLFEKQFVVQLTAIITAESTSFNKDNENLEKTISDFRKLLIGIAVVSILLSLILGLMITNSVVKRLTVLEEATKKIASGNFDSLVTITGNDEFSFLSNAFNQMTISLKEANHQLSLQQEALVASSKMSALGEMAGGVAHEINTPLAVIQMRTEQLVEMIENKEVDLETLIKTTSVIQSTTARIAKIVKGLKTFSRDGSVDPFETAVLQQIIDDTLILCLEKNKNNNVAVQYNPPLENILINCRPTQISQVILNLINNSFDAIQEQSEKWIKIEIQEVENFIEIAIIDNGKGISADDAKKIMNPFFTTKAVGKGTGLGLSISLRIIKAHHGKMFYDSTSPHTRFVIQLPKS